ncbi:hypothetical protein JKF63_02579 [Porcisia hertigi]|uniref:Uncharacterized protein n=1 Tax=Porcisia hertigi TaxID=2761500 RepID=A0A836I9R8_9TRYP|nr:hypothetical protein JKF63_02579 [Porcisia hertigi]
MSVSSEPQDDSALLVRIIEEGLFLDHMDKCNGKNEEQLSANHRYLAENVFPTLVPALQDLIKQYRKQIPAIGTDSHALDKADTDPVMWLAQYLLRNSARSSTSRLSNHPFQIINRAALNTETAEE